MPEGAFTKDFDGTVTASSEDPYARAVVRGKHELLFDEGPDLPVGAGNDDHPSPVDYMCAALAACQVSVLHQALERARIETYDISCDWEIDEAGDGEADEEMPENTHMRVRHIDIDLTLEVPEEHEKRAQRCLDAYDTGCIVGQSFKAGVDYTPHTELVLTEE